MFASLLSLGAKYVPGILKTIGSGVGRLLGSSETVKRIGHKINSNVVGRELLGIGKNLINTITQPSDA